LNWSGSHD